MNSKLCICNCQGSPTPYSKKENQTVWTYDPPSQSEKYPYPEKSSSKSRNYLLHRSGGFGVMFVAKNDQDDIDYIIKGSILSFGARASIEDIYGNLLFKARQENMHVWPTYSITLASTNQKIATIKKPFECFKNVFKMESVYGKYDFQATDLWANKITIHKNGQPLAIASRKCFAFRDSYSVEFLKDEDHAFILIILAVIDKILQNNRSIGLQDT